MSNKFIKISIGVFLLFVLVNLIVYFSIWSSDAFAVAKNHVKDESEVIDALGADFEMSLQPYGYGITSDGNVGDAHLVISVVGNDGAAKVFVELEQNNSVWLVTKSQLKR